VVVESIVTIKSGEDHLGAALPEGAGNVYPNTPSANLDGMSRMVEIIL